MPNRYEREIEEILRNLESSEPKPGLGQKFSGRFRRKPTYRIKPRRRNPFNLSSLHFKTSEWLIFIAVIAALFAGGYAYANGAANLMTGIIALIGAVCLVLLIVVQFLPRAGQSRSSSSYSTRYGNVTPLRRNPLTSLKTRWDLFLLKLRYRRKKDS